MATLAQYLAATWLCLAAGIVQAAVDSADKAGKEPTVSAIWIILFVLLFVGVCVFIGVAAVRAERKSKATPEK